MYMQFCEKPHWRTLCVSYLYRKHLAYYTPMTFRCLFCFIFSFLPHISLANVCIIKCFSLQRKDNRNLGKHFLFLVFWHRFYNRRLTMMSVHYITTQTLVWNRCTYISVKGSIFILRERGHLYRRRKSLHFIA